MAATGTKPFAGTLPAYFARDTVWLPVEESTSSGNGEREA